MDKNNCNELHIQHDKKSGCTFIIALNTTYGDKGNGGTRMLNYSNVEDGIKDATKLVKAMTKKCVVVGKKFNGGYSGGKGVIVGNPATQKTPEMLRRFGKFVQTLNGRFQTGTDMNINLKDIEFMAEKSEFIDGLEYGLGDTAIPTAFGILLTMKELCKWKHGNCSLNGKIVAVQGTGSVGRDLIRRLVKEGAEVIATDVDAESLQAVKDEFGIKTVSPDEIYGVKCDIFSPNACGGVLTNENIRALNCDLIIGAANNPLVDGLQSVIKLKKKGITYVPDYVINIGGVFLSMCEVQGKDFDYVIENLKEIIPRRLQQIIKEAENSGETLFETAERIVAEEVSKD
ncbi:MAG: Glu/Leu/Phe/Val dehydrogenase dimerization domain-containing protein [archaeon]|nr:NAD(P)-binding domain-containing protein [Nanoarchaeota archaeon]